MSYASVHKFIVALRGSVSRRHAAITKMMVEVIKDEIKDGSFGRLPPPEVFVIADRGALLGYTNKDDIKTFKKEEAVGTRPYSKMMNKFRAGTMALLRKKGFIK